MKKISFVAPCYNEQDNVKPFYELVNETMKNTKDEYEIVFVNDGSKDGTYNALQGIFEQDTKHIKVVNFLRNFGKEAAILAGLNAADGDYISVIDSDMQQEPKYVLEMVEILENNPNINMVAATPKNKKDPLVLAMFKKAFYIIINKVASVPFYQGASDFRTFRKCVRDAIVQMPEHDRFSKGIFSWVCPNIERIEYVVQERGSGTSKWSFWKLFKYAIDGIFSFSYAPLFVAYAVGTLELLLALAFGVYASITPSSPHLWVICTILAVAGVQSVQNGISNQYILKNHKEVTGRPLYIVKNTLKGE